MEKIHEMSDGFRKSPHYRWEVETAKFLVYIVWEQLQKHHPNRIIKSVDSNYFHFVIYDVLEEMKKKGSDYPDLTRGWYIHGPYLLSVDDALVELKWLDQKYHQLDGECGGEIMDKLVVFDDDKSKGE